MFGVATPSKHQNMQREASSLSARPLAARRPMVATLWQSLRMVSVKNVPY